MSGRSLALLARAHPTDPPRRVDNALLVDKDFHQINLSSVFQSRFSRKYSVNKELIRRGLACVPRLDDYSHDFALKTNAEYSRLINQLIISEKYADRRGVGMWRRRTALEALLSYPSQIKDRIEHTSFYRLLSLIGSGVKQLGSLGYSTGRQAGRLLSSAASDWRKLSKSS